MDEHDEADALPVLARDTRITPRAEPAPPALSRPRAAVVQAAAAAAGGFVAGAAVLGIVQQRRHRSALTKGSSRKRGLPRRSRRVASLPAAAAETLQVVSSRTLLVDVHLLGAPDAER